MSQKFGAKLSELLLSLNSYEFCTLAFIIGIILCDGLNYNQQQSLGNFFEQIGQTILTIGAQNENLDNPIQSSPNISDAVELLKGKIGNIEKIISDIKKI